jgi:hypothetical protein
VNRILGLLCLCLLLSNCVRRPPNRPEAPIGPVKGEPSSTYSYVVALDGPDNPRGEWTCCRVDWGDGSLSEWDSCALGQTECRFVHKWEWRGDYWVAAQAQCANGQLTPWSESLHVVVCPNRAPVVTWGPAGPHAGTKGTEYQFAVAAGDSDRNRVRVRIDWGDGNTSAWTAEVKSGDTSEFTHSWPTPGRYRVSAQAIDEKDQESDWSPAADMTICTDTTYWRQQVAVNSEDGAARFSGGNRTGHLGSLNGTYAVVQYPEFGGYFWELAPGGVYLEYDSIDLTGCHGADSIRVEWSCRDGHGGQAQFTFSVNQGQSAFCANPDSASLHCWRGQIDPRLLTWNSADNYARLVSTHGTRGKLLVCRIEWFFFGVWTTDEPTLVLSSPADPGAPHVSVNARD